MPMPRALVVGAASSTSSAPTRPCSCTRSAQASRTSSTTTAPRSRRSGPCSPPSAAGAPPWCSPSPTRAPTSAPAAPRPSSRTTAPGTSTASSASSPRGDSDDLFENIFHLVLARPEGAGPGTKGLSLFFVPKFHFDPETGELGERNGVFVTNVEHKMGLKVSATCELSLGQHGVPAVGWLVGEVHDGIAQMFEVIEQARMMVGTKAIATLSTGYLNALEYAKERVQGADLTQMTDKTAPRVTHHAPPRRAPVADDPEGLRRGSARAVPLHRDVPGRRGGQGRARRRRRAGGQGQRPAAADRQGCRLRAGLRQAHRERCRPSAVRASCRTTRSSSTSATPRSTRCTRAPPPSRRRTSSSARSSATRVWRWRTWPGRSSSSSRTSRATAGSRPSAALLATALDDVQAMAATLTGYLMAAQEDPSELYKVGLGSVRFLMSVGDLVIGWLLQQAGRGGHRGARRGRRR